MEGEALPRSRQGRGMELAVQAVVPLENTVQQQQASQRRHPTARQLKSLFTSPGGAVALQGQINPLVPNNIHNPTSPVEAPRPRDASH
jgi:hypothetical protein